MAKFLRKYDASRWTGEFDPVEPIMLAVVLAIGAFGFIIIWAVAS